MRLFKQEIQYQNIIKFPPYLKQELFHYNLVKKPNSVFFQNSH